MQQNIAPIMLVLACSACTCACQPGPIASDDEAGETSTSDTTDTTSDTSDTTDTSDTSDTSDTTDTSDTSDTTGEPGEVWAEITCRRLDTGVDACFGRPVGSVDAWVMVSNQCQIDELEQLGAWIPVEGWTAESCAAGQSPAMFMPDTECGWLTSHQRSVCMAGGEGWYTQTQPACELDNETSPAWAAWLCAGEAGDVGPHPWDSIVCFPNDLATCSARDNGTGQAVWPTCWVDQLPPAPAPC